MYFGVWCHEDNDWMREPIGGKDRPILVFENRLNAEVRAVYNYGFQNYYEVVENGWAEVRAIVLQKANSEIREELLMELGEITHRSKIIIQHLKHLEENCNHEGGKETWYGSCAGMRSERVVCKSCGKTLSQKHEEQIAAEEEARKGIELDD